MKNFAQHFITCCFLTAAFAVMLIMIYAAIKIEKDQHNTIVGRMNGRVSLLEKNVHDLAVKLDMDSIARSEAQ